LNTEEDIGGAGKRPLIKMTFTWCTYLYFTHIFHGDIWRCMEKTPLLLVTYANLIYFYIYIYLI